MALQQLPEAELAEGVSIDGYSTYWATRFSEAVLGPIKIRVFFMPQTNR